MVDGVLQPTLVATDPRSDGLPGGVSHSVTARRSKSWSLVSAEDPGPKVDLCNNLDLHPPWTRDFLVLVLGAMVMPNCSSRARGLPVGTEALAPKDSISSASQYIFSTSVSLKGGCSSLVFSSMLCPLAIVAPQQASLELLGSQEPPALSQKAPPLVMRAKAHQAVIPRGVAHSEVLADQRVDSWCSCVWYGECEPSIILEREEYKAIFF
jgi:hypothetical protein